MAAYNNNPGVCTEGNIIEVRKRCTYKESLPNVIAEIEVLDDRSDEEYLRLTVRSVRTYPKELQDGRPWEYVMRHGQYCFNGMPRIYDLGTYFIPD